MFIKRIISSTIDLSFAFLPVAIGFSGKELGEYYFFTSFLIYLLHTTIALLINPQKTPGEILLKIEVVYKNGVKMWKALLRNFLFALLIFGPLISSEDILDLIFMYIPLLALLPQRGDEGKGEKVNGADILFKTYYNNN